MVEYKYLKEKMVQIMDNMIWGGGIAYSLFFCFLAAALLLIEIARVGIAL